MHQGCGRSRSRAGRWARGVVLDVAKLTPGREDYYLERLADNREEYLSGHGESPGRWYGQGAASLGLDGEVSKEGFRRLIQGRHPSTGELLVPIDVGKRQAAALVCDFAGELLARPFRFAMNRAGVTELIGRVRWRPPDGRSGWSGSGSGAAGHDHRPLLAAIDQALHQGARARLRYQPLDPYPDHDRDRAADRDRRPPGHVWRLLRHRLHWRLQRPARRAVERDEQAIARWVAHDWPWIRSNARRRRGGHRVLGRVGRLAAAGDPPDLGATRVTQSSAIGSSGSGRRWQRRCATAPAAAARHWPSTTTPTPTTPTA
jgi:TrwC relaxase/Winged helix-turn helix